MDKRTFRLLTEIEREMRAESWSFKSMEAISRKDSPVSHKRNEELEELRMRNSLINDDLQYKTRLLSEKMHEMNELSVELERLQADNDRLLHFINLKKEQTQEKARSAFEKDWSIREDIEKSKARVSVLEKQADEFKAILKQRDDELAHLTEQNQTMKENRGHLKEQLRLQLQSMEKQFQNLDKQLKDGQGLKGDLQRKNAKLESELDTLVRENSRLTTEARELRNELKSIYDLKIHLNKLSKESSKERVQAANNAEPEYKLRYEQLMNDYDRLKQILDQHKTADYSNDKLTSQLASQAEALSNENRALKIEINKSVVSYEKQLRELRAQNEELQGQIGELRSKVQYFKKANIHLEDELKKTHSEVIDLSNDQFELSERLKQTRQSPQRSPRTRSSTKHYDIFRTPDRRSRTSPGKYEPSPVQDKYSRSRYNLTAGSPSKVLRPLNQNVTWKLTSPKSVSEFGKRKPCPTEPSWLAKGVKSTKSERKFPLIERSTPSTPRIAVPKDQNHHFYKNEHNELEDEFKLFYSVSKILDDSLSEQNSFGRVQYRKTESPAKTQMICKTLGDVNHKLDDLKDNLTPRMVWHATSEVEQQWNDLPEEIRLRGFREESRHGRTQRVIKTPEPKEAGDVYSIIAMQSDLIKKLLNNIK